MIKNPELYTEISIAPTREEERDPLPSILPTNRPERQGWWSWLLLALAAYLGLAFGLPAWGDYQALANFSKLRSPQRERELVVS
jgi:hypothetical protein